MTHTKHTPGLWRCGLATGSFSHYRVDAGDKTPVIAAVIESEDDARLIAAAPELLEALQELAARVDSAPRFLSPAGMPEVQAARRDALVKAERAIAKATGES